MPHGVKLMRSTTLSAACAGAAGAKNPKAAAPRSPPSASCLGSVIIVAPKPARSCDCGALGHVLAPRDQALDPGHQRKEARPDHGKRDDRSEGTRRVEVEASREHQVAEAVRG